MRPAARRMCSRLQGEEALRYNPNPDDSERGQVVPAAASCPVPAIIGALDPPAGSNHEMTTTSLRSDLVADFKATAPDGSGGYVARRVKAAEALRDEGFTGSLTLIDNESCRGPTTAPAAVRTVLKGGCRRGTRESCPGCGPSTETEQDSVSPATGFRRPRGPGRSCCWPTEEGCPMTGC